MKQKVRLAIITTHPIQYNAPLFKYMQEHGTTFTIRVFYTWSQAQKQVFDRDFGIAIKWDLPLLEGYESTFVANTAAKPGTNHYNGMINPTLTREIEEWGADALLVFGWSFASHLQVMRHFHIRIPVLFRGDSTLIDEPSGYSIKKMIRRLFLRWVYRHVDYALYVGSANKDYFLAHGLTNKQLVFGPHAVDNERFIANQSLYSKQAEEWRQELGIGTHETVFLFAAKLIKKKDPELLIKSFLAVQMPASWLVIVGNGELEVELKEKYESIRNILFIDFQNQGRMPVVYRLADVFVLPSMGPGETWGLAVNEAMACSRAIIVSDVCGCSKDLVVNGTNGYVCKHGDQKDLERVMLLSAEAFVEKGKRSREIIDHWCYPKTVQSLNELFAKENF